ncbi:glucose-1-phosphate cytidylyltransferase [Azospirillum rugosum]|uniref:Glucose-1-phosphate cytidylyltransferase n=1 Tax=Azospirillum rugosum TaxID=416170 RepID=A0ABS4SPU7_9PROT|nr:glucose-1-phosphate cytidylyltransferase [Azospirillum rugosum]MBP2294259.1 glucose-1-phosphate cytidylyltransferase [Azospirillum rugosum]MDQ0527594.1 glucose-1-phosphate cytidylyltransferase [Azospirillum rugosum]
MKAVILAGGLGSRLSEETVTKPKPMVEIGGRPILWHIMKIYSHFGVRDFVICLGYKGFYIKEFFANLNLAASDVTIDVARNTVSVLQSEIDPWRVTLVDTGLESMTGGRLKRIRRYLDDDTPFFMTYGDGVADVDITKLLAHHVEKGRLATVTAVRPVARFGALGITEGIVTQFAEKPIDEGGLINGGYFVLSPETLDLVDGDDTIWERQPMERLAEAGQLAAFQHHGFWHPMDTLRDRNYLDQLCSTGRAPWMTWV